MFSFLLLGQISVISLVNFSRFRWCGMLCSLWWQMFANFSFNLQHKLLILVCDWLTRLLCGHGSWVAHFRGAGRARTFSADSDRTDNHELIQKQCWPYPLLRASLSYKPTTRSLSLSVIVSFCFLFTHSNVQKSFKRLPVAFASYLLRHPLFFLSPPSTAHLKLISWLLVVLAVSSEVKQFQPFLSLPWASSPSSLVHDKRGEKGALAYAQHLRSQTQVCSAWPHSQLYYLKLIL